MYKNFQNLNVLISGASGFIGKNLVNKLSVLGSNITILLHNNLDIENEVEKIVFDGSYESLYSPLKDKKIDVVIHLATYFLANHKGEQLDNLIDSNVKFGTFLLELTKQKKIPYFINTSTYAQSYNNINYSPQNLYSATKQAFETIMKYYEETSNSRFVTLELTDTYGPGDPRPKFINLVLNAISKGGVFNMSEGEQEICYLFIEDAVDAYVKCIDMLTSNEIISNTKYSVFSDEVYKLKDLVDEVCNILEIKIETNRGYYPYRDREIMKFKPTYPILTNWASKISLKEGLKIMTKIPTK